MKINVLGTEYSIEEHGYEEDKNMEETDGYCDKTSKRIVIAKKRKDCEISDFEYYQKKVKRHEIVHAFLFESGLAENFEHGNKFGHEETIVDWFAIQGIKIYEAWKEADAL